MRVEACGAEPTEGRVEPRGRFDEALRRAEARSEERRAEGSRAEARRAAEGPALQSPGDAGGAREAGQARGPPGDEARRVAAFRSGRDGRAPASGEEESRRLGPAGGLGPSVVRPRSGGGGGAGAQGGEGGAAGEEPGRPSGPAVSQAPRADVPAPSGSERAALARAVQAVIPAIEVFRAAGREALALDFGPALGVELRRAAGGIELVMTASPTLAPAARLELPELLRTMAARGVTVVRAEVRQRAPSARSEAPRDAPQAGRSGR